ncbi:ATP-binding cassette domain-containing protein, partial [Bacillus haynesii]|uniref:ATP-binding cassette domain-containing protein n=1 Tax=Bacillus haynesii TaxID=1925021 RepID=UPI00227F8282
MINVRNLSKSFGKHEVLKHISVSFEKGEVAAVIGPSGSGKSTCLRCLNLHQKPTDRSNYKHDQQIKNP